MIPVAEPDIGDRELELATDAIESGWVSPGGEYVEEFERRFAERIDVEHALATSTGTAALHLSLVAAGIGRGDEVIVPDLTWIGCANAVRYARAEPVFADVTPDTLTLDPESVREAVSEDTIAIMPVHLYGHPCDIDPLADIAAQHDLFVIEDCAEALGAEYRDRPVGSIGDAGCFSFYGNKMITTGQGGMITTDDDELAERIRLYRRDGMSDDRKYYHPVVGFNYRLTNVQAAIGVGQLSRLDQMIERRRANATTYREVLAGAGVDLLDERPGSTSVYWMNVAIFESSADRRATADALAAADVETRPVFHPLHEQPPYRDSRCAEITTAGRAARRGLLLPSSSTLDRDDIEAVGPTIRSAVQ